MSFCLLNPGVYPKYFTKSSVVLAEPAGATVSDYGTLTNEAAVPSTTTLAADGFGNATMLFVVEHIYTTASVFKANLTVSWCLGIFACVLMLLPSISSIPSVGNTLIWKEWIVLQSWFGIVALCLATGHVLALGIPSWDTSSWTHNMPNVSILSTIPAEAVILLRLLSLVIILFRAVKRRLKTIGLRKLKPDGKIIFLPSLSKV